MTSPCRRCLKERISKKEVKGGVKGEDGGAGGGVRCGVNVRPKRGHRNFVNITVTSNRMVKFTFPLSLDLVSSYPLN